MPPQNRVTPSGVLIRTTARGTLMGNRGCLHNAQGQIQRSHQGKRWIICQLAFKERQRKIMQPGRYTELFFLDEVTALAAGHRPCAECMRARFNLFREYWVVANPIFAANVKPSAVAIDMVLHRERITTAREKVAFTAPLIDLPTGIFVMLPNRAQPYLLSNELLYPWHPEGYGSPICRAAEQPVEILTPHSVVQALAAGYPAKIHHSLAV